jgi:predicted acetyltransferase
MPRRPDWVAMAGGGEIDVRTATPDDAAAFIRAVEGAFGHVATDDDVAFWTAGMQWDRFLVAVDSGQVVAGSGADQMELTLPAPEGVAHPSVAAAAVTAVGVLPTHRRRGIQRRMMSRLHADARARGEAVAVLTASESLIYRRYGYGLAAGVQVVAIDPNHAAFLDPPATGGRVRLVDHDEALKILPALHEQCRRLRPGDLSRPPDWWTRYFADRSDDRGGGSARFYAVHESGEGEPDGFVTYRFHRPADQRERPGQDVRVDDVYGRHERVDAALWRFVLDLDLVREVVFRRLPLDSALPWRLVDPRRLRTQAVGDHLWVCLLDVARALSERGFESAGTLVFEVVDGDVETEGTYALDASPAGATCRRARRGRRAQLRVRLADLGAAYLGGVPFRVLASAGRIDELDPGAVARADALFRTRRLPWCGTDF